MRSLECYDYPTSFIERSINEMSKRQKASVNVERFGIETKKKNKLLFFIMAVVILLALIALVLIVSVSVQLTIRDSIASLSIDNDANATWVSSLASYWGAIIGGVISGVLSVIGVALTIRYYRSSDEVKNRLEHMPFLMCVMSRSLKRDNLSVVNPQKCTQK